MNFYLEFLIRQGLSCLSEKAMAPHSSTLAWKIPWTEEPGRLWSMGSLTVEHDWVTSLSLFTFMHWRRKWQPTPVFLPGESQGRGSLVGCRLWGRTESDTTEATYLSCLWSSKLRSTSLVQNTTCFKLYSMNSFLKAFEKKKNILKGYLKKLGITGQITNLEKIIQTPKVHTRRGWDDLRE